MTTMIYHGDARSVLATLPAKSVQMCVTSPPYFGLRSYLPNGHEDKTREIGAEPTVQEYVGNLVAVFREVWRVLKDDGTLWLNLGDSYAGGGTIGRNDTSPEALARRAEKYGTGQKSGSFVGSHGTRPPVAGLKPKDIIGIPWRVAFALQDDGWILRSDIIWHKPNPMPESVTDRPTKSHEYLFLLSKQPRYYYDAAAIAEPVEKGAAGSTFHSGKTAIHQLDRASDMERVEDGKRNKRSVWTVATQPFSGAHYATFPPKLIEPCILAGSREGDTVLDPFGGSGTTGMVAERLGRNAVLIDLNAENVAMAKDRITGDAPLFADVDIA